MTMRDDMRRMFWERTAERERIIERAAPLRAERDRVKQEMTVRMQDIDERIKAAEEGLYEVSIDIADAAKFLGKTGVGQRPEGV